MIIALIEPPIKTDTLTSFKYPPIGLIALGSYLINLKHEVVLIDSVIDRLSHEQVVHILEKLKPDFIGISAMSVSINSTFSLAENIKKVLNKPIVVGGIHPTVMPEHAMSSPCIDYCVIGEGEYTFQELIDGKNPVSILGLAYRRNGKIIINSKRPLIEDINNLPFLNYDLVDINKYKSPYGRKSPFLSTVRSRGCPYQCTFCGNSKIFGKTFRVQSPERTLDEVIHYKKQFNIKEISFKDTELTLDKNLDKLCDLMIKNKLNIIWSCNGRVNNVNYDLLKKMKKAGCYSITYGIESGNERILKLMKKSITLKQIRKAIEFTRKAGIQIVANFMIGNIGDTKETIEETINFSKSLDIDYVSFSLATPFPGTEMRELAIQNKWMLDMSMDSIRYDKCVMNATDLETEELNKCLKKAFREFYFRPGYIVKRILRSELYDLKNYLWGFSELLK